MNQNSRRYFLADVASDQWGINVITAGYSRFKPGEDYPDSGHPRDHLLSWNKGRVLNGYYLVFITDGKGILETESLTPTLLEEGNVLILFPGMWHRYKPVKEVGWEEYWVGFNGPYSDFLMNNALFSPSKPLVNVGLNQQLINTYNLLIETDYLFKKDSHPFLCGLTLQIIGLVQMIGSDLSRKSSPLENGLEIAFSLMHDRVGQSIDFVKLAQEVGLSYPWFRKMFREKTGVAPNQYFIDLKIRRAKELLKNTALTISEISYMLDFSSPFYFSRLFKQKTGRSPAEFRRL